MKIVCLSLLLATASAFTVQPPVTTRDTSSLAAATKSFASDTKDSRILKAGAGVAIVPCGNNLLFDPSLEGKLGNTNERIQQGLNYKPAPTVTTHAVPSETMDAQDWLEDIGLPLNFAKPNAPVIAKVLGRSRVIGEDAPGDIEHVLLELPEGMHYVEGQSLSVIPPGVQESNGKPHKPRLYSIASTRYGDLVNGRTVSLCVRRAEYYDPVTGLVDPSKQGLCSNFLCSVEPGTEVKVAGPVGKTMLLPEDPSTDVIMVATGTGIAPFRSFLHRLFMEQTVARHLFTGEAWLVLGVPTTSGLLYPEEFQSMQDNAAESAASFKIDYAISREMKNQDGGKLYVQNVLAEQADALLDKLDKGAHIYFCGLKGMMPGILTALEEVCTERGMDFAAKQKEWKSQWHVEVY